MKPNVKKGLCFGSALLIAAGIVAVIVWLATRPKSPPINPQSSLTLIKAGFLQADSNTTQEPMAIDGFIQIDSTFLLENSTVVTHYLTINATVGFPRINITTTDFNNDDANNVSITMMDLMVPTGPRIHLYFVQELDPMEVTLPNYRIDTVNAKEFPFALPSDFDPQLWRGAILVQQDDDNNGKETILARVGFTINLLEESSSSPSGGHVSKLMGADGYSLGGTITLQYRNNFVDGNVVQRAVLLFENISPPIAPGPYLYLTHRPMDMTNFIDREEDLQIKITVGSNGGAFTVGGNFELDWEFPQQDPVDYIGGSWIVWCDPFRVRLGFGSIVAMSD